MEWTSLNAVSYTHLAVMYLFAFKLAYIHGMLSESDMKKYLDELLSDVPEKIGKSIELEEKCSEIAEKYKNHKNIFFIGRGADYILSMESALKLKEISYIHCEAYAAGELKQDVYKRQHIFCQWIIIKCDDSN